MQVGCLCRGSRGNLAPLWEMHRGLLSGADRTVFSGDGGAMWRAELAEGSYVVVMRDRIGALRIVSY